MIQKKKKNKRKTFSNRWNIQGLAARPHWDQTMPILPIHWPSDHWRSQPPVEGPLKTDNDTLECHLYTYTATRIVILTRTNLITTLTTLISTRTRAIFTRRVWFWHVWVWLWHSWVWLRHARVWIIHARVDFQHEPTKIKVRLPKNPD
jgi:hypothetical protein